MGKSSTKWVRNPAILVGAMPLLVTTICQNTRADNWLNTAGGSWTNGANWSTGAPPADGANSVYDYANFSLGSTTGYTVLNVSNVAGIQVQGDQPTLSFTGALNTVSGGIAIINVTSVAGQTSSLTMLNADFSIHFSDAVSVGGTGGTSNLTMVGCTINGSEGGSYIGGGAGSVVNYNQVGGTLSSYDETGIYFGSGAGTVNAIINGGIVSGEYYGVTIGSAGHVNMNVTSGGAVVSQSNFVSIGTGSGTANVTVNHASIDGDYNFIGATQAGLPNVLPVPATGGGTGVVSLNNAASLEGYSIIIGASQGNGTLTVSQSTCSANLVAIGDKGTGVATFSNGSALNLSTGICYVGGSGGTGTLSLSGSGTTCNLGFLDVGTDGTANGTGVVELDHSAVLAAPDFTDGGQLYHGTIDVSATGTLKVFSGAVAAAGILTEVPGSTLEIGLDGASDSANGQIDVTSTATFAGTLDVVFENDFQPAVGEQFQLFSLVNETGHFSTLNLPAGYTYDLSQLYTSGLITVTSVPEPVNAAAVVVMMAALGRRNQRTSGP